jgi:hypothetical protein
LLGFFLQLCGETIFKGFDAKTALKTTVYRAGSGLEKGP